jgi:hypothetical protein
MPWKKSYKKKRKFIILYINNYCTETVAWRKQLQDALSHNKQYFISGMDKFGQKGMISIP